MKSTIEWFDVKEKLPDCETELLLTNGKEIILGFVLIDVDELIFYGFYFDNFFAGEELIPNNWITHWAHVPYTFEP